MLNPGAEFNISTVNTLDIWGNPTEILVYERNLDYKGNELGLVHRSEITIPVTTPVGRYYLGPYIGPMRLHTGEILVEHNLDNNATYMEVEVVDDAANCTTAQW